MMFCLEQRRGRSCSYCSIWLRPSCNCCTMGTGGGWRELRNLLRRVRGLPRTNSAGEMPVSSFGTESNGQSCPASLNLRESFICQWATPPPPHSSSALWMVCRGNNMSIAKAIAQDTPNRWSELCSTVRSQGPWNTTIRTSGKTICPSGVEPQSIR